MNRYPNCFIFLQTLQQYNIDARSVWKVWKSRKTFVCVCVFIFSIALSSYSLFCNGMKLPRVHRCFYVQFFFLFHFWKISIIFVLFSYFIFISIAYFYISNLLTLISILYYKILHWHRCDINVGLSNVLAISVINCYLLLSYLYFFFSWELFITTVDMQ